MSLQKLPVELITEIALSAHSPRDALALAHSCRLTYYALHAETNNRFWFRRKNAFPTKPFADQHVLHPKAKEKLKELIISQKYDENIDYKSRVAQGNTFIDPEDPVLKCSFCVLNHADKFFEGYNKSLCWACFDVVSVECRDIRFLKLDRSQIRTEKSYNRRYDRLYAIVEDVEKQFLKKHGHGQNMEQLIKQSRIKREERAIKRNNYRVQHGQKLADMALEKWKDSRYDSYRFFFGAGRFIGSHIERDFRDALCTQAFKSVKSLSYPASGKPKKETWLKDKVDRCLLPDDVEAFLRLDWVKAEVGIVHQERLNLKSRQRSNAHTHPFAFGVCKICYEDPNLDCREKLGYMRIYELAMHYGKYHYEQSLVKDQNGEYYDFLRCVPDREVLYLDPMSSMNRAYPIITTSPYNFTTALD